MWVKDDWLPTTIAQLSPQCVRVRNTEEAVVVNIQVSGGFQHFGFLVVCSSRESNFKPTTGRNWRIREIAPNVFEYAE